MKKLLLIIIALCFTSCTLTPREEILLGGIGGLVGGGIGASVTEINLATGALVGYVAGGGYQTFRHYTPDVPQDYINHIENSCVAVPKKTIDTKKIILTTLGGAAIGSGAGAAIGGVTTATGAIVGAGSAALYNAIMKPEKETLVCTKNRLDVSFARPSDWNGQRIPGAQVCQHDGGNGATPPLIVRNIPEGTNVLIVEFNDLNNVYLSHNGGNGKVGFYHNGSSTAWLLPVPGETNEMPPYAFREAGHRGREARGTVYLPPCSKGQKHLYAAQVVAAHRSGDFYNKRTTVLAKGDIVLGKY